MTNGARQNSVAVAAVDFEPGVIVVAPSVTLLVAGEVAEIVAVASAVDVVMFSCASQRTSRKAGAGGEPVGHEHGGGPFY